MYGNTDIPYQFVLFIVHYFLYKLGSQTHLEESTIYTLPHTWVNRMSLIG